MTPSLSLSRHHQGGKVEPSAHPLPDWRSRSNSGWHADGGLPHGHTTHPTTKVRFSFKSHMSQVTVFQYSGLNPFIRFPERLCGSHQYCSLEYENKTGKNAWPYFMDTVRLSIHTQCAVALNQTRFTGWLMSLPLITVQESTKFIKCESSNIETLKLQLNNPVGIYLLSVSVRESLCARNSFFPRISEAGSWWTDKNR